MRRETVFITLSVCVTIVAASAIIARGGPLDPPDGPVQATYKTLDEVEPRIPIGPDTTPGDADAVFRITEPGSYYLAGPLAGEPDKHGIEIAASGVTLDLRGHSMTGGPDSLDAVHVSDAFGLNIHITTGSIESWGNSGVNASDATGARIENLSITLCSMTGVRGGTSARMADCVATHCATGFRGSDNSSVRGCVVEQCSVGILVLQGSLVKDCAATSCTNSGIQAPSGGAAVVDCVVSECAAGIFVSPGSTVRGCEANNNDLIGILAGNGCLIVDCVATSNGESGIGGNDRCVVRSCVAEGNVGAGVDVQSASTVADCNASGNGGDGISAVSSCSITSNTCESNGGAGIHVTGDDNRVEANLAHVNGLGFDADGQRNIVVRNHARANGQNYAQVEPGNVLGAIVSGQGDMNAAENDLVNFSF